MISKGKIQDNSYLYFIDDGSVDNTWEIIEEMHQQITQNIDACFRTMAEEEIGKGI